MDDHACDVYPASVALVCSEEGGKFLGLPYRSDPPSSTHIIITM